MKRLKAWWPPDIAEAKAILLAVIISRLSAATVFFFRFGCDTRTFFFFGLILILLVFLMLKEMGILLPIILLRVILVMRKDGCIIVPILLLLMYLWTLCPLINDIFAFPFKKKYISQ